MTAESIKPLIEIRNLRKEFSHGARSTVAVADASFSLYPAECLVLLGPSGSGKTTVLTIAAGLAAPTRGEIELFGKPAYAYRPREMQRLRARRIGFIFQSFRLLDPLNVTDNLVLAGEFAGLSRTRAVTNAHEVLHKLEIDHLAGAFPSQLSQGEKQRVATARALINRPSLLIADEPTASLESKQAMLLVELLVNYVKSSDGGLLVATHDLRILPFADRVIRIEDGVLSADFPNNDYRPKLKETPVQ